MLMYFQKIDMKHSISLIKPISAVYGEEKKRKKGERRNGTEGNVSSPTDPSFPSQSLLPLKPEINFLLTPQLIRPSGFL